MPSVMRLIRRDYRFAAFETPIDPTENPDDPIFSGPGLRSDAKLNIPGNLLPWLQAASEQTGVPMDLLAGVVYQHSRWSGLTPQLVYNVAGQIAQNQRKVVARDMDTRDLGVELSGQSMRDMWLNAAADYGSRSDPFSQAWSTYRDQIGRLSGDNGWAVGTDVKLPTGKFALASFPGGIGGGTAGGAGTLTGSAGRGIVGLTADEEDAAHAIADSPFMRLLGRLPTDEEYRNLTKKHMTPSELESYLRAQPNPNVPGKTLGQTGDIRALANKYAGDTLGRDASEGEINWLLQNGIPASDAHVGAYYEQIRDNAVWKGDPVKWTAMRSRMQSVWNSLGLTGQVDANTVNGALAGNWTEQQARESFRALPAPGYPPGTTVGQVEDQRGLAAKFKGELFTAPPTDAELKQLIGRSPDEVRAFYRSMPSQNIPGLQAGQAEDYKSVAQQVLKQNGVIDHEPTADEVRLFALQKFNADQIIQHYGDDPALAARQPGLPYGMSKVDYERQIADYQSALTGSVGKENAQKVTPPSIGTPEGANAGARDQSLLGYALRRKMSSQQFGNVVEKFRQENNRLPNGAELGERLNRAQDVFVPYRGQVAEPAIAMTDAGPTITGTGDRRGSPRPAI